MRIVTEVGLGLRGDVALAKSYVSHARTLLGIMKATNNGLAVQHWERFLPDGTKIVLDSIHGTDYITITAGRDEPCQADPVIVWTYDDNSEVGVSVYTTHQHNVVYMNGFYYSSYYAYFFNFVCFCSCS